MVAHRLPCPGGAGGGRSAVGQIEVANIHRRHPDILVHCRATGTTVRVSVDSLGGHCNDLSTDPAINGDGSPVEFFALASTPGPGDTISCSINDQMNFTGHSDPVPRYLHPQQPAAHPKADKDQEPARVEAGFRQEAISTKGQSHGRADSL